MRLVALAVALVGGCTSPDTTCNHTSDGSYPAEGYCTRVDVSITNAAGFDEVELLLTGFGTPGPGGFDVTAMSTAPTTPAMIAAGEQPPIDFDVAPVFSDESYVLGAETVDQTYVGAFSPKTGPATSFTYEAWDLYSRSAAMVFGFSGGATIGGGYAPLRYSGFENESDASFVLADGSTAERWGLPGDWDSPDDGSGSWTAGGCARVTDAGSGTTHYVLRPGDYDCDGVQDDKDCQPTVYCDPSDISPAGIAACACP